MITRPNRPFVAIPLLLVAVLAAWPLTGCGTTKRPSQGAAPATPQRLEEIRARYASERPGTIVGPVVAVLPEQGLASLGDVPADRFAEGDLVSLIDSREQTLAIGRVVRRLEDSVHVKYERSPGMRAPVEGDVGVRLPAVGR